MVKNYDYRFGVKASLQVMREQREKICADSLYHDCIYTGLHEINEELQKLYFQYYLVEWLSGHWSKLQEILDSHPKELI